jgi:hypothetical protein
MKLYLLAFLSLLSSAHAEDLEAIRWQTWEGYIPNIVICNGANVNMESLKKAVNNWRSRGEKIGKIYEKSCEKYPERGEIAIYASSSQEIGYANYGITITNVFLDNEGNQTSKIFLARIFIEESYLDSRILLEHEIGHSLGFKHSNNYDSIMSNSGPIY